MIEWFPDDEDEPDGDASANATPAINLHVEQTFKPGVWRWTASFPDPEDEDDAWNLLAGRAESAEEAKATAERTLRSWIAEQAAALCDGWIRCEERLPEADGWYHVAACDYKDRYPRHAIAQFAHDRFWLDGDDGEGDRIFAWQHPALPALPEKKP